MSALWGMLRAGDAVSARARLDLALDLDCILGFDLAADVAAGRALGRAAAWRDQPALTLTPPPAVAATCAERTAARTAGDYRRADTLRVDVRDAGWTMQDGRDGTLLLPLLAEDQFVTLSRSADATDRRGEPDRFRLSLHLLAHNSRADLERCVASLLRHSDGAGLELVIVDNGSTDDTLPYLRGLSRDGLPPARDGVAPTLQVLFADHDMGFGAARNASLRACSGQIVALLDTSIELCGDVWPQVTTALSDPAIGLVGPYGLVTTDLREFQESDGPEVDAIEGYLLAFPRALLGETGLLDERFRFYRLLDIHFSFFVKAAGYRVVALPAVAALLEKHPHREWYSLTEEEQRTRSKKNYDLFRDRWHHGESLLAANYAPAAHWPGHDHPRHVAADHIHAPEELPPQGQPHSHMHHHWPDHSHEHPHIHHTKVGVTR